MLPVTANLLTVAAFYLLARSIFGTWPLASAAAVAFALLPRGFEWLVMGGGLTRSLGFFFALAVLSQTRALLERPTIGRLAVCTLLAAACLLSHLEMGLFLAYSYALFLLTYGRRLQSVLVSGVLALGAVALSAPWWVSVLGVHGLAPFQAASGTSGWSYVSESVRGLVTLSFTDERLFPALAGLGALGLIPCLLRGNLLLPVWLVLIFLGTPRSAATEACVPLAMLIALAIMDLIVPGVAHLVQEWPAERRAMVQRLLPAVGTPVSARRLAVGSALGLLLGYVVLLNTLMFAWDQHLLHALGSDERSAMSWIAQQTSPAAHFLVISPSQSWEADYVAEWFPALAQRRSVLTAQGAEWLPEKQHDLRVLYYNMFKSRGVSNVTDLEYWARQDCVRFSHVYVSKSSYGPLNWTLLQSSLVASPDYRVLLNTPASLVLERSEPFPTQVQGYPVASDCRALADESPDAQDAYVTLYGDRAGQVWLEEHERALAAARGQHAGR
jgi:hypothetical protein